MISAANNGHIACVAALLAYGADPTTRNGNDKTPRDLAHAAGFAEIVSVIEVRAAIVPHLLRTDGVCLLFSRSLDAECTSCAAARS